MARHNDAVYVSDMAKAVDKILHRLHGVTLAAFEADDLLADATIRQLEIVGEAAAHVSDAFRESHPTIDWRGMKDLRNVLIHGYAEVNLRQVWGITQREIPMLAQYLTTLLQESSNKTETEDGREPG